MKYKRLLDRIGEIDDRYIAEAAPGAESSARPAWVRWAALAACLCLIVAVIPLASGVLHRSGRTEDPASENAVSEPEVPHAPQSLSAEDYFRNSRSGGSQAESSEASLVMPPYAVAVSLNHARGELEEEGVLPDMPEHPEHSFQAAYNGDGSLYKVTFSWMRRGAHGLEEYSDLKLTAAPKKLHEVSDEVSIAVDPDGTAVPAGVTVTERDGILLFAGGGEREAKTISWQTEQGWYQITGSWNDSYEAVVALLDWFWAHPLSLSRFAAPEAGTVVFSGRAEQPDAFREQIPDFPALGYTAEAERVTLGMQDGTMIPVWFEGIYTRGEARTRWTVSIGADDDAWASCLGRPNEASEEMVTEAISEKSWLNLFFDMPCMATLFIEQGTAADAWEIVQSLQQ